jgi:hypothetical protein
MAAVPTFEEVSAMMVEAAVRGAVSAGASRQQAAAVASAAVRTALSVEGKCSSDVDYLLGERLEVIKQSLVVHQGDCKLLGHHVHSAARAAALVGGAELKSKVKLHRGAGFAKHVDLHSEEAVGTLRCRRGGRQRVAVGLGVGSGSNSGKGSFRKGKGTGHRPGFGQAIVQVREKTRQVKQTAEEASEEASFEENLGEANKFEKFAGQVRSKEVKEAVGNEEASLHSEIAEQAVTKKAGHLGFGEAEGFVEPPLQVLTALQKTAGQMQVKEATGNEDVSLQKETAEQAVTKMEKAVQAKFVGADAVGQFQGEGEAEGEARATSGSSSAEAKPEEAAEGEAAVEVPVADEEEIAGAVSEFGVEVIATFSREGLAELEVAFEQATDKRSRRLAQKAFLDYLSRLDEAEDAEEARLDELDRATIAWHDENLRVIRRRQRQMFAGEERLADEVESL